ncbi:hypothetical protein [Escherichia coli]|uniref:hypothetical protein n=1 Tax=Escherichia coli TaxID=562 RepID=UPI002283FED0|nr:hypothetical protein [Escherichia coli]MCZ0115004.1 hypothetical protein [Escherichia coli]MCZ0115019.1 hypothetical protein [Escherichia coli]MCZ0115034.1 hypothetical protein [Escherichia coli]
MKTLLIALLLSIISFYSYSAENAAVINQTISGTIKNKITQRGFSANDPRYYGTLKGISGYLNLPLQVRKLIPLQVSLVVRGYQLDSEGLC